MRFFLRLWAILTTIPNRLVAQWGLVLASVLGLIASVSLVMSIPLYADAVYMRILQRKIYQPDAQEAARPPFSFLFIMNGGSKGTKQWEDIEQFDNYFMGSGGSELGLPIKTKVGYTRTEPFALFPLGTTNYQDQTSSLGWTGIGFMTDLENHIQIVEGRYPEVAAAGQEGPIEVLVSEDMATKTGLQAGEQYIAFTRNKSETGELVNLQIPILVSGIWKPVDSTDSYWMFDPGNLDTVLFVPKETFTQKISAMMPDEVYTSMWFMMTDGTNVHSSEVGRLLGRIYNIRRKAMAYQADIEMRDSPAPALVEYQSSANLLTILLYAFAVPILGLILAFVGLVARLSIERQRNEIAVLRSRGATTLQIMTIIIMEALLIGLVALVISSGMAILIAQLIGRTRSFLDFSLQTDMKVSMSFAALRIGLIAIGVTLIAQVLPAIGAAKQTIVTYKQELSRPVKAPFWQRAYLDLLLFIPAGYGAYLLSQQGSIAIMNSATGGDPFRNPLLFLVPALGILAASLFFLRLIQPIMAGIAWLASSTKNVGLLLAARQLSRSPGSYHTPLVILILTLSLSAYTASLALTLDQHLYDQMYYKVGTDMAFLDAGDIIATNPMASFGAGSQTAQTSADALLTEGRRFFIPVSEYLKIPGVTDAMRIGSYPAQYNGSDAYFIGVDRTDFPRIAYWRDDFAAGSLGGLMNALATTTDGVLVSRGLMQEEGLQGGDLVRLTVNIYGQLTTMDLRVVGSFDLFPTWYPEQGPLFVGNLDYLFQQTGSDLSYYVFLKTDPNLNFVNTGEKVLPEINPGVFNWQAADLLIQAEQQRPERQGLFGMLFIGFAAAAVLTVLAFLLYVLFSFQRRFIELGVLRASGLSNGQMTSYMAWELAFLVLLGGLAGTVLGVWASNLFIPYMQVGSDASSLVPPFDILINWQAVFQIYFVFGILFVVTLMIVVTLLRRMKVFQAIKLGETV
jgi:putative ABC transport system permease protein